MQVKLYNKKCITFLLLNSLLFGCASGLEEKPEALYGEVDLQRSAKYNIQLGIGYLEQGDVERAKDKFLKALKQAPKLPEAHYNIAHFYYLIEERDLADQHFNKAINYSANNEQGGYGTACNNYGVFLCQTKQYDKAYEQFSKAIDDPNYADSASAYENAGLCALQSKDKNLAVQYFNDAIKKNPLAGKSLIELSQFSYDKKDYQKAKTYLQRYNQIEKPNKRSLLLNLKLAYSLGNKADVNSVTNQILQRYPDMKNEIGELNKHNT